MDDRIRIPTCNNKQWQEQRPEAFIPPTISSPTQMPESSLPRSAMMTAPAATPNRTAGLSPRSNGLGNRSSTFPVSRQTTSANISNSGGGVAFAQPSVSAPAINMETNSPPLRGSLGSSILAGNLQKFVV